MQLHKYTNNITNTHKHKHRRISIYFAGEKWSEAKSDEYNVPRMDACSISSLYCYCNSLPQVVHRKSGVCKAAAKILDEAVYLRANHSQHLNGYSNKIMTFHTNTLPPFHGTMDAPSGLLPSDLYSPVCSKWHGIFAVPRALLMMTALLCSSSSCRVDIAWLSALLKT